MKTIMLPAKQGTRRSSSAPLMGRYLCHFPLGVGTITAPDGAPSPSTPPVMFQCHAEGCAPRLHREQTPASPGTQRGRREGEVAPVSASQGPCPAARGAQLFSSCTWCLRPDSEWSEWLESSMALHRPAEKIHCPVTHRSLRSGPSLQLPASDQSVTTWPA